MKFDQFYLIFVKDIHINQPVNRGTIMNNAKKGITRVRCVGVPAMQKVSFDITDLNGSRIEAPVKLLEHAADAMEVAISTVQSGIFYLKIFDGTSSTVRRIILQ